MLYYRLAKTETCCTKLDDTTGSYVIVPVSFSSLGLFAGASGGAPAAVHRSFDRAGAN